LFDGWRLELQIPQPASSDELEINLPGDIHALVKLDYLEASYESRNPFVHGFLHLHGVRRGSIAEHQFVRSRKDAVGRVSPNMVEEGLIAHLNASEADFIDSLRGEGTGMLKDRGQQTIIVLMRSADYNPVERPVLLDAGVLEDS